MAPVVLAALISALGTVGASAMAPKPKAGATAANATGASPDIGAALSQNNPLDPSKQKPQANIPQVDTSGVAQIAQTLAQYGPPPPSKNLQGIQKEQMGPPKDLAGAPPASTDWGSVLAAAPQAIALAAPMLGLGPQPQGRQIIAPVAGDGGGNYAMQMPFKRASIGEVLSSLRTR